MRTILSLVLVAATCAGCVRSAATDRPGRLAVVATVYPLAFAVERIGDGCVDVTDLTPTGAEPHDLELTPRDVEAIAAADVVLYLGGGFQPAIEDAIDQAQGRTVDLLRSVRTLPAPHGIEGAPAVDPHVWLDPTRFAAIATAIAAALDEAGVPDRCDVGGRADALRRELGALDGRFREGLADCDLDVIVTSHAAFGYLTSAYGLRQVPIAGLEPDTEPDPSRMAEIADLIEREGVRTIFTEELVSPAVAETVARETGADTAVLATIEALTAEERSAGTDYVDLMEEDLDALRSALACA